MQKEIIKYDDLFKRTVLDMLESVEFQSMEQAKRIFNIKGSSIISRWIKKFGKEDILPKIRISVESMPYRAAIRSLKSVTHSANTNSERTINVFLIS